MNDLNRALGDISSIRKQMASATEFRGYGPATLAATGVFALVAALVQRAWVADPVHHISAYLSVWIATAVLSAGLTGVQMYTRSRRIHSALSDEMIGMAVEQFLPAVGAGLLLTVVIVRYTPPVAWMLPGLWQVVFSLGIFSSCRFLPRPMIAAGVWYLLAGLGCIALAGDGALSPWAMGVPFGMGQMLVAAILLLGTSEDGDEG
jgi:hypothetical protein